MRNSQAKQGEEYKNVNGTIARLKEDLESTKRNYEEQLSAMTEHIMEMNDKLQQQDAAAGKPKSGRKGPRRSKAAPPTGTPIDVDFSEQPKGYQNP